MKKTIRRVPSPVSYPSSSPPVQVKEFLIVLDFDQTIIHGNSGMAAKRTLYRRLGSSQSGKNSKGLSQNDIVTLLNANGGIEADISAEIRRLPPTTNMVPFIRSLQGMDCERIIISDAHPFFIKVWLKSRGMLKLFPNILGHHGDDVPKRPPSSREKGDGSWCYFCSKYMCKGLLLKSFLRLQRVKGVEYERVIYVGDGINDFCPVLRLRGCDIVFARDGFGLQSSLLSREYDVAAIVYFWKTGDQIKSIIENMTGSVKHRPVS